LIPIVSTLTVDAMSIDVFLFYSNTLSFLAVMPFISLKSLDLLHNNLNIRLVLKEALFGMIGVFAYYLLLYKAYDKSSNPLTILPNFTY
jgi:hypothetical protein